MTCRSVLSLAFAFALMALAPVACKDDPTLGPGRTPDAGAGTDAGLQMTFSEPPLGGLPAGVRFASAVPYGADPTQVLDIFLPSSAAPTAAIVYFHGGGFMTGTRSDAYVYNADDVQKALAAGIAWIGVDYRLLQPVGTEKEGVIKSLRDCRRALQFVRHAAASLNVDPNRIGLDGNSAGAGASMWLAFHDDMAKPESADPVERESTRPQVIGVDEPQATYDVLRWAPDVLAGEYPFASNDALIEQEALRGLLVQFYGLDPAAASDGTTLLAALNTPEMVAYRADVDLLVLMTSDDPAAYLISTYPNLSPLDPKFDLLHHPLHGKALNANAGTVGARLDADISAYGVTSATTQIDFLITNLAR